MSYLLKVSVAEDRRGERIGEGTFAIVFGDLTKVELRNSQRTVRQIEE